MAKIKHGKRNTRLYHIWRGIKQRTLETTNKAYPKYGGRGITICDEWKNDFMAFYEWAIKNGYNEELTIDRINNDGNYEPCNCRWTTKKVQANNRSNNILITFNDETLTEMQWCEKLGIKKTTLSWRLKNWTIEKALTTKKRAYK